MIETLFPERRNCQMINPELYYHCYEYARDRCESLPGAVLKERSATRAARRLNVTQSAVSNSLTRLRALLDDPLVVCSGRRLVPAPRANELFLLVDSAIGQLQGGRRPRPRNMNSKPSDT
jgi:Bacterial regulatory helix-turn-helix protein, lysR family